MVECLPIDPAAQVRFQPWAVGIFLHPVTLLSYILAILAYFLVMEHEYCCTTDVGCETVTNYSAILLVNLGEYVIKRMQ